MKKHKQKERFGPRPPKTPIQLGQRIYEIELWESIYNSSCVMMIEEVDLACHANFFYRPGNDYGVVFTTQRQLNCFLRMKRSILLAHKALKGHPYKNKDIRTLVEFAHVESMSQMITGGIQHTSMIKIQHEEAQIPLFACA